MMQIHTFRCSIRPFEEQDLNAFSSYRNDLNWMKYQGFKGLTIEEYRQLLLVEPVPRDGAQFAITLSESNQLIGDIYLKEETEGIWLGYTIAPNFARQGFAEEAVRGVLTHLKAISQSTVFAGVEPENLASVSLLKKMGFTFLHIDDYGEKIYRLKMNT